MPTIIKNQRPTTEIRAELAAKKEPILVAFSCGKDAIATELALQDAGITTELAYLYYIPGKNGKTTLGFIEDTIDSLENSLQKKIHKYPHPSLWRWLNSYVFQPPERLNIIEAAKMPTIDYDTMWDLIRNDLNLPKKTLVADGVRAADSIVRRASFTKHGILKPAKRKVSPIADWLKGEVIGRIDAEKIALPIDYDWFGRSFDGIDYRFLAPLKEHAPNDYQTVLDWFPLADLEIFRHTLGENNGI
ncbi:adenine nucleotide alpha hydrolase family protein [Trueperella pyogenes]